jgi:hypothetical protein
VERVLTLADASLGPRCFLSCRWERRIERKTAALADAVRRDDEVLG